MRRPFVRVVLGVLVAGSLGCSQQPPEDAAETAYQTMREVWQEVETAEEKAKLAEEFLAAHPTHERAPGLVSSELYYRGEELDQPQVAYDVAKAVLDATDDPERRFEIAMAMRQTAARVGQPMALGAIVAGLAEHRPLTYSEHVDVIDAATAEELWPVVLEHSEAAIVLATADQYRKDNEDRELSEEEVAKGAARRQGTALAAKGWALARTDQVDEAMAVFQSADQVTPRSYLGVADTDLPVYWGRTLLGRGEVDAAIALLAPAAIFGAAEGATDALREAFVARTGSDEAFEEFLWQSRQQHARVIDDVAAKDYQGTLTSLADVRQDKALLLAFWFPT